MIKCKYNYTQLTHQHQNLQQIFKCQSKTAKFKHQFEKSNETFLDNINEMFVDGFSFHVCFFLFKTIWKELFHFGSLKENAMEKNFYIIFQTLVEINSF